MTHFDQRHCVVGQPSALPTVSHLLRDPPYPPTYPSQSSLLATNLIQCSLESMVHWSPWSTTPTPPGSTPDFVCLYLSLHSWEKSQSWINPALAFSMPVAGSQATREKNMKQKKVNNCTFMITSINKGLLGARKSHVSPITLFSHSPQPLFQNFSTLTSPTLPPRGWFLHGAWKRTAPPRVCASFRPVVAAEGTSSHLSTWALVPILLRNSPHQNFNVVEHLCLTPHTLSSQSLGELSPFAVCFLTSWSFPTLQSSGINLHWLTEDLLFAECSGWFSVLMLLDLSEKFSSVHHSLLPSWNAPLWPSCDNPTSGSHSASQLSLLNFFQQHILLYPTFKCWIFPRFRCRLFPHSEVSLWSLNYHLFANSFQINSLVLSLWSRHIDVQLPTWHLQVVVSQAVRLNVYQVQFEMYYCPSTPFPKYPGPHRLASYLSDATIVIHPVMLAVILDLSLPLNPKSRPSPAPVHLISSVHLLSFQFSPSAPTIVVQAAVTFYLDYYRNLPSY